MGAVTHVLAFMAGGTFGVLVMAVLVAGRED